MGKIKTHKATAKRFRITRTGKILQRTGGQDHFNARETAWPRSGSSGAASHHPRHAIRLNNMPRVKRGQIHLKKRRSLLARAKGFKWGRKNLLKRAKVAVIKAGASAYQDRRVRKRDFRKLWNIRVNAAARANGLTYSTLIDKLHKAGIGLNRKVLSELAVEAPQVFEKIAKM